MFVYICTNTLAKMDKLAYTIFGVGRAKFGPYAFFARINF